MVASLVLWVPSLALVVACLALLVASLTEKSSLMDDSAGHEGTSLIAGDDPRCRCIGDRCIRKDGTLIFDFQTGLEFYVRPEFDSVTGGTLEIDMDGGRNHFDVLLDGEFHSTVWTTWEWSRRRTYTINLMSGTRTVALVKRTEPAAVQLVPFAKVRPVTVYGVRLSPGWALAAPSVPARRVEVVGDSDVAAFGVHGPPTGVSLLQLLRIGLAHQNIRSSWAHILCAHLGAEPSVIAWSGIGVSQNSFACPTTKTLAGIYAGAAGSLDAPFDFSVSAWTPQIVLVEVGANDLYGGAAPPPRQAFEDAYVALLALVRGRRPAPCLLLAVVPRLDTPLYVAAAAKAQEATPHAKLQAWVGTAVDFTQAGGLFALGSPRPGIAT